MSKKHFVAFAAIIATQTNFDCKWSMANMVIAVAKEDNPRFDEARFLKACDLTDK